MGQVDEFLNQVLKYQKIILDTNVVIYFLEGIPEYCMYLQPLFEKVEHGQLKVVLSVITEAELLVKPYREKNIEAVEAVRILIDEFPNIEVVTVSREVARKAAEIRSESGLKLPDAIIVATGILFCSAMIGNDASLSGKFTNQLPYIMLSSLISSTC
jgi:predicted nucleic acid-binding protein